MHGIPWYVLSMMLPCRIFLPSLTLFLLLLLLFLFLLLLLLFFLVRCPLNGGKTFRDNFIIMGGKEKGGRADDSLHFPFRNFNSENTTLGGVQAGSFVIFKLFLHFWKKEEEGVERTESWKKTRERRREGWPDSKTIPRLTLPSPFFELVNYAE